MFLPATTDEINQRRRELESVAAAARAVRDAKNTEQTRAAPSGDVRRLAVWAPTRRIGLVRAGRTATR